MVDIWQQKYEDLVVEKADLEQHIRTLQTIMTTDLHQANQQVSQAHTHTHTHSIMGCELGNFNWLIS